MTSRPSKPGIWRVKHGLTPEKRDSIRRVLTQRHEGDDLSAALFANLYGNRAIPRRRDFVEAYIKIKDKWTGNLTPFRLNRAQRRVELQRVLDERAGRPGRYCTLKARQLGISTYWLAEAIEATARNKNLQALIVGDEDITASSLLESGKVMMDELPAKPHQKRSNGKEIVFGGKLRSSLTIASARAKNPGRGKTYRFVHATEPAFWLDTRRKMTSLMQAVPDAPDTVMSLESTGNGIEWFHDFFWDAWLDKNDYHAFFFPWWWDENYSFPLEPGEEDEMRETMTEEETFLLSQHRELTIENLKWRRRTIRNKLAGNLTDFRQEYPSTPEEAFQATGSNAFTMSILLEFFQHVSDPIEKLKLIDHTTSGETWERDFIFAPSGEGELWIWRHPQEGHSYIVSVDSCEGVEGGDYSGIQVLDAHSLEQVAEHRVRVDPAETAMHAICIAIHYNRALVIPEVKGPGIACLQALRKAGYPMVARRPTFGVIGTQETIKLGWDTNGNTKMLMVNEARAQIAMLDGGARCHSSRLRDEAKAYRKVEGGSVVKYESPRGKHDDLLDAWMIALLTAKDALGTGLLPPAPVQKPKTETQIHWAEYEAEIAAIDTDEWDDDDLFEDDY